MHDFSALIIYWKFIMKILITGAYGQLGNEMKLALPRHTQHTALFTDADTLDICDPAAIERCVQANGIEAIVNCAAYTAVDKAETDETTARRINCDAVQNLGVVAARHELKIVHISTDYVFEGNACQPYTEQMSPAPISVYGRTKLAGEQVLSATCADAIIIRTAWLYSPFGNNFMKTMLRLGREREQLNVVFDQIGTPTYGADLAEAIYTILDHRCTPAGIYHFTNEGVCSWYDFTLEIHKMAGINCRVQPITSDNYPTPAPRPHYSVLNKAKIKNTFHITIPHWTDGLQRCLKALCDYSQKSSEI